MADEQPWHIVSADYLNTLGNFFIKWSGDFSNAHVGSLEMKVTPGQAQPAYAFKTVFTTNTDTLSKQLDKARDAFLNTGLALKGMALTYNNTEDDNAKDAEKIRPFVDGLMADYPGASVIIPPPPGGYPPPPPGAGGGAPGGSPPKGA